MKGKSDPLNSDSVSDAGRYSAAQGVAKTTHHGHHRQLILETVHS